VGKRREEGRSDPRGEGAGEARRGLRLSGQWLICLALALLPLVGLIAMVMRYAVDVPYMDEWELVGYLEKSYRGTLTLHDLWLAHNEHRILFPRLILIGLARLTGWNVLWELAASIVIAIGLFAAVACLTRSSRRLVGDPGVNWLLPAVSVFVFSLAQYENWLMGWQIQFYLNVFAVAAGLAALARRAFRWWSLVGALLMGVVATYSAANGMLYWFAALPLLFALPVEDRRRKRICVLAWSCVAAAMIGSYLYDYHKPAHHPPLTLFLTQPFEFAKYVFFFLGHPLSFNHPVRAGLLGIAGLAGVAIAAVFLLRFRRAPAGAVLPWLALALYSVGGALVSGVGRLGFGAGQALSPRYVTLANLFWISNVVLLYLVARTGRSGLQGGIRRQGIGPEFAVAAYCALGVMVLLAARSSIAAAPYFRQMEEKLLPARAELRRGENEELLGRLYPDVKSLLPRLEVLKKRRLSVFREGGG
jgi:hypothetical protein